MSALSAALLLLACQSSGGSTPSAVASPAAESAAVAGEEAAALAGDHAVALAAAGEANAGEVNVAQAEAAPEVPTQPERPRLHHHHHAHDHPDQHVQQPLPEPIADCVSPAPRGIVDAPTAGTAHESPTAVGSPMPTAALLDFQPLSCGVGKVYGLETFTDRVTLVGLLSSTCGYCLSQTVKLEQLRLELEAAGHAVNFVLVSQSGGVGHQFALAERASFPMLQDVPEVNAWALFGGAKDDFYIYDAAGRLHAYLPASGDVDTNLSSPIGYANVRDRLLAALGVGAAPTAGGGRR